MGLRPLPFGFLGAGAAVGVVASGLFDAAAGALAPANVDLGQLSFVAAGALGAALAASHCARRALGRAVAREAASKRDAQSLASRDPLTGLLNRRGLEEHVAAHGLDNQLVLLCDLNDFKRVNDLFGHAAGDDVLRQVAARLSTLVFVDVAPVVARLGGDEFMIIVPSHVATPAGGVARIQSLMAAPFELERGHVQCTMSVGVALGTGALSLSTVLEQADRSMYEAKDAAAWPTFGVPSVADATSPYERAFERNWKPTDPGEDISFVAAIAIDRLRDIRRALGHDLGGKLLRKMARRVALADPGFQFQRFDEDMFGVAFRRSNSAAASETIARLRDILEGKIAVANTEVDVRLTIGLAGAEPGEDARTVVERARFALDDARRSGHRLVVSSATDAHAASANIALMRDLREAIAAGALEVHYQPKLTVATGKFESMEALVRWCHPVLGPLAPSHFIPIAEQTGDIRVLTDWVIDRVIADRRSATPRVAALSCSVNISAELVGDSVFALRLLETLAPFDGAIGIEITETAVLARPERALSNLHQLKAAGIGIAIDDYGVGLSSLSYIKQLPASELKLDAMFIRNLGTSHRDPIIVRSTLELAHGLGLKVTAEGVDSDDAIALLCAMRCDMLQGFSIARPMPHAEIEACLLAHDERETSFAGHSFAAMLRPFAQAA